MGKVLFGLSVSLDGFIADKYDDVSEVFAWMGSGMEYFFEVAGGQLNETGAVIMGQRSFDHLGPSPIHLEHIRTLETPGATHVAFRVVK